MTPNNNIIINKNRGWRGVAEVIYPYENEIYQSIFSFSSRMWTALLQYGYFGITYADKFILFELDKETFKNAPLYYQQRSVLIKNLQADIKNTFIYDIYDIAFRHSAYEVIPNGHRYYYDIFVRDNDNYYTTSKFNDVGIRVNPDKII